MEFETHYNNAIQQLLFSLPKDAVGLSMSSLITDNNAITPRKPVAANHSGPVPSEHQIHSLSIPVM